MTRNAGAAAVLLLPLLAGCLGTPPTVVSDHADIPYGSHMDRRFSVAVDGATVRIDATSDKELLASIIHWPDGHLPRIAAWGPWNGTRPHGEENLPVGNYSLRIACADGRSCGLDFTIRIGPPRSEPAARACWAAPLGTPSEDDELPAWRPLTEAPAGNVAFLRPDPEGAGYDLPWHDGVQVMQEGDRIYASSSQMTVSFRPPDRCPGVEAGLFRGLTAAGSADPIAGGLRFNYGDIGGTYPCEDVTGAVAVDDVTRGADGVLVGLRLRFHAVCRSESFLGEVRWTDADGPAPPPSHSHGGSGTHGPGHSH